MNDLELRSACKELENGLSKLRDDFFVLKDIISGLSPFFDNGLKIPEEFKFSKEVIFDDELGMWLIFQYLRRDCAKD